MLCVCVCMCFCFLQSSAIETSLVELSDGEGQRAMQKAKIVLVLSKIASVPVISSEDDENQVV